MNTSQSIILLSAAAVTAVVANAMISRQLARNARKTRQERGDDAPLSDDVHAAAAESAAPTREEGTT